MLTAARLSQFAHQLAEEARVRADYYKEQLRLLQARQADIETSLNASKFSRKRFARFQAKVNGHFQCPRCWIEKQPDLASIRSPVRPEKASSDAMNAILRFRRLPGIRSLRDCRCCRKSFFRKSDGIQVGVLLSGLEQFLISLLRISTLGSPLSTTPRRAIRLVAEQVNKHRNGRAEQGNFAESHHSLAQHMPALLL